MPDVIDLPYLPHKKAQDQSEVVKMAIVNWWSNCEKQEYLVRHWQHYECQDRIWWFNTYHTWKIWDLNQYICSNWTGISIWLIDKINFFIMLMQQTLK
jgi:hypothetical protein